MTSKTDLKPETTIRPDIAQFLTLDQIAAEMRRIRQLLEKISSKNTEYITLEYNIPSLRGLSLSEQIPFDGEITEITITWPEGCRGLVGVALYHTDDPKQFLPKTDYLSFNNITKNYGVNVPVTKEESVTADVRNGDSVNSHDITIVIKIVR